MPSDESGLNEVNITYWFEDKRQCDGRQAVVGVGKLAGSQFGEGYFKGTLYLDNGEFAQSGTMQRTDLAFDNAETQGGDNFDIAFILNAIFVSDGKNFLTNGEVWNSTEPVILHNVTVFGNDRADIAIAKIGTDLSAIVPCTIFALSSHNSPTAMHICVARMPGTDVPYAVYVRPENPEYTAMMPTWTLTGTMRNASGIMRTLQCLQPVYCPYVEMPSAENQTVCEADGNHLMREFTDEYGCTLRYECTVAQPARLYVYMYNESRQPFNNLEVDVWRGSDSPEGPPDLVSWTNAQGKAEFNVTQGTVWVGFNGYAFPTGYYDPGPSNYQVYDETVEITIVLQRGGR